MVAQDFPARRGGMAVLLGRWVAFFRAVMPALAGASRMPYRTFLRFNAVGGLIWGVVVVTAGYLAGSSYARIEQAVGRDGAHDRRGRGARRGGGLEAARAPCAPPIDRALAPWLTRRGPPPASERG